ncbi:uncharacterized protein V6R79_011493 [Siganus canaliculatus]
MLRNMSSEGPSPGQHRSFSAERHGGDSSGLESQESSWIGLFSVVSRPAMSFLQKYLPGRARMPALSEQRSSWIHGDVKTSFVDEEREFLQQLDDMMPLPQHAAPHLTYVRCQHDAAGGLLEPMSGSSLRWLTPDSLQEIGINDPEEVDLNLCQQGQVGYLSSFRTFFNHVLLSSLTSQEMKGGNVWSTEAVSSSVKPSGGKGRTWWGSFWGGEDPSQRSLQSDMSWAEDGTLSDQLCPQNPSQTKALPAETTNVVSWMLGENAGPVDHKEERANNEGLQTVQNQEDATPDQRLSISNHLSSVEAATACSEVALLTPDQDNGYSSLEEEHVQICRLYMVKAQSPEHPQEGAEQTGTGVGMDEETPEEGGTTSEQVDEEEEGQEVEPDQEAATSPQCQNKAIAFIMGCPCSDDDSSQSGESTDDDDDDGFDSEGSSDLSESSDDEEEDDDDDDETSDSEVDSEAERLWNSLCQTHDPYNPRNFTARLHTRSTPPRTIPNTTPPTSAQSTPASSPDLHPHPLSPSPAASSPLPSSDVWDDSTSASEVDEAENLRLWSSFSCSSDPYSPFNFQAPLRTQTSAESGPRTRARKASSHSSSSSSRSPASTPRYRKEEAEERMDSGFAESTQNSNTTKKVRFCDDVEEFFASCGEEEEDRRGPWEELARDRCRFLKRCQEVEQTIAYCLQPQHRRLVYRRLTIVHVQEE